MDNVDAAPAGGTRLSLALIVFGLGLECSGLVNITAKTIKIGPLIYF